MTKWMTWIIGYYAFSLAAVIVIIILSVLIWDKRYKKRKNNDIPAGYIRTEEVSIDPETEEKKRVYYNPKTGERIYINEYTS